MKNSSEQKPQNVFRVQVNRSQLGIQHVVQTYYNGGGGGGHTLSKLCKEAKSKVFAGGPPGRNP